MGVRNLIAPSSFFRLEAIHLDFAGVLGRWKDVMFPFR